MGGMIGQQQAPRFAVFPPRTPAVARRRTASFRGSMAVTFSCSGEGVMTPGAKDTDCSDCGPAERAISTASGRIFKDQFRRRIFEQTSQ